jgi:hypothetical protein
MQRQGLAAGPGTSSANSTGQSFENFEIQNIQFLISLPSWGGFFENKCRFRAKEKLARGLLERVHLRFWPHATEILTPQQETCS